MTTPVLMVEPLTKAAFEPFGEVIELEGAINFPINEGTTTRFHDLANVDVDSRDKVLVNLFRSQPRKLPFEVSMLERHPRGSQAFIPLSDKPFLVVVAPAGELDPSQIKAFITQGWQGVNYARGVWHHPLMVLNEVSDFIVIDRGGEGANCDVAKLQQSLWIHGIEAL